MRDCPDDDDSGELSQFAGLQKKVNRLGYAMERTAAGYRLDAPGVVVHRVDMNALSLVLTDRRSLAKNLK